jgi:hypothetical protein
VSTKPIIEQVLWGGALFQGLNRPGLEADHLPPFITDVKYLNAIHLYVFVAYND